MLPCLPAITAVLFPGLLQIQKKSAHIPQTAAYMQTDTPVLYSREQQARWLLAAGYLILILPENLIIDQDSLMIACSSEVCCTTYVSLAVDGSPRRIITAVGNPAICIYLRHFTV